jgi:hypothetical protein
MATVCGNFSPLAQLGLCDVPLRGSGSRSISLERPAVALQRSSAAIERMMGSAKVRILRGGLGECRG